jgi:hypothetical protein
MDRDSALRELVNAIALRDDEAFLRLLRNSPQLAKAKFEAAGATRKESKEHFVREVERYIYRGDTALHFAAAAYQVEMMRGLVAAGADVRAKNRLGAEPLHGAAVGSPGSARWNPAAQGAAIAFLVEAGADPNATDKLGASPLHKAVRTRCAEAVRMLLECGADPSRTNKRGSTALKLAMLTTGRGGTGSPEAKAQQEEILKLLEKSP